MFQSSAPSPDGPQAPATAAPWLLAVAVASLMFGALSLLLLGAFIYSFISVYSSGLFGVWFYAAGFACGITGVVLGHLARALARRAALGGRNAALATTGLVLSYGDTLLSLSPYALIYLEQLLGVRYPLMN